MDTNAKPDRNVGAYVVAALFIVFGVTALISNLGAGQFAYESIPFGIGVAFLVAYVLTRQYGFLVPGGILAGVGAGLLLSTALDAKDAAPYAVLGLGLGFVSIYVVDMAVSRRLEQWWPLIPGGIMLLVGTSIANGSDLFVRSLQVLVPLGLIAVGVAILLTRLRRPAP